MPRASLLYQPHRPGVPGHRRRHGDGPGRLPVPEHLRPGAEQRPSASTRATPSPTCRPTARTCPSTVSDYQEYNEALLEVTIPAEEEVELTMEYGGFPQESRICPPCRAARRSATNTSAWKTAALSPRADECACPERTAIPPTIEITLPESMTGDPLRLQRGGGRRGARGRHQNLAL